MTLNIGDKAPQIELLDDQGEMRRLSDYAGKPVIVFFYPKDDTPGCTIEACSFRDNIVEFRGVDAAILGISKDSVKSHAKFRDKYDLNFPLLADEDGVVCTAYDAWQEKSMYGKKYMGIQRMTFLIDKDGKIAHIWPKVSVIKHTKEVLAALENLP